MADPSLPDLELAAKCSIEEKQTFLRPDDSVKSGERAMSGKKVSVIAKCLLVSHPDSLEQGESVLLALFQLCFRLHLRCCVL